MYLKGLEVVGFKSFSKKTYIEFEKGISSIIGPNGSGKSNILDAILWVLGEQSYKSIRAKESSDVIFSGGKFRKPAQFAKVSLIIDNSDNYLDIKEKDVIISRKINRSGEGEYTLNDKKVRLKDIQKLLMDTGIGKQAYSIIGQGRVEKIISSNPKDIKEIIEEAAGIKKAKFEKEQTLKELDTVNNNLEKIEIIYNELEKKVSKLEKEANNAKIYKHHLKKKNDYNFLTLKYDNSKYNNILLTERNILNDLIVKRTEIENKNFKYINDKKMYDENIIHNLDLKNENKQKIEKLNINIKNIEDDIKNNLFDINNIEKKIEIFNEKILTYNNEIIKFNIDIENLKKEIKNLNSEKSIIEKEYHNKKIKIDDIDNKLEKIVEKYNNYNKNKQDKELEIHRLNLDIDNNNNRINQASIRLEIIEKEYNEVNINKNKSFDNLNNIKKSLNTFKIEKDKCINLLNNLEKNKKIYEEKVNFLNDELLKYNKVYQVEKERYEFLKNRIEQNLDMNKSVKYISDNYNSNNSYIGIIINLISFDEKYNISMSTLANSYFQDIVVKNSSFAKDLILELKNKKIGSANFLPIDSIKSINKINIPKYEGFIGFARELVEFNKDIQKVVDNIFGNSIIVENIDYANKIKNSLEKDKINFYDRIVTLDGDIITSKGRMTGGYKNQQVNQILEQKTKYNKLKEFLKEKKEKINNLGLELEENRLNYQKIKPQIDINLEKIKNFDSEILQLENKLNFENQEYKKYEKNIEVILSEKSDYKLTYDSLLSNNKEKENLKEKIITNIVELDNIIISLNNEIEEIQKNKVNTEDIHKLQSDIAVYNEKINQNNKKIFEYESNSKSKKIEIENIEKEKNNIDLMLKEKKEKKDIFEKEYQKLNIDLEKINSEYNFADKEIEVTNKNLKNISENMLKLQEEKFENDNKIEKLNEKIDNLENKLFKINEELNAFGNDYEFDSNLKFIETENEYEIYIQNKKMAEQSLSMIGYVNFETIDEYNQENKRYQDIIKNKKDIEESKLKIEKYIKEIDSEMNIKFSEAYNEINNNFKKVCYKLLNKSKGQLLLLDENNLLQTGIEIRVKYSNKNEQSLELLSGGEKSMLAVAFILSIFMYKPSPFTFFDEIEAALDENNTKMLIQILREFVEKSQFILITHNKETMRGSDKLYGVTMNKEIGETLVMSVSLENVDEYDE